MSVVPTAHPLAGLAGKLAYPRNEIGALADQSCQKKYSESCGGTHPALYACPGVWLL